MRKVECIIRPTDLEAVILASEKVNISGMSVTQIVGYGEQKGATTGFYRGVEYDINLKEKLKVEIVVEDEKANELVEAIVKATRTEAIGDGKIFVYTIDEVVRIRTGERGEAALRESTNR